MKVLLTIQEPGKPRHRCITSAPSTFAAVNHVLHVSLDPNTYVSAKPASEADVQAYPELNQ